MANPAQPTKKKRGKNRFKTCVFLPVSLSCLTIFFCRLFGLKSMTFIGFNAVATRGICFATQPKFGNRKTPIPASMSGQQKAQHGPRSLRRQRHRKPQPDPEQKSRRKVDYPEREHHNDQRREYQVEQQHVNNAPLRTERLLDGWEFPLPGGMVRGAGGERQWDKWKRTLGSECSYMHQLFVPVPYFKSKFYGRGGGEGLI